MYAVADVGKDDDGALTDVLLQVPLRLSGHEPADFRQHQTVGWRAAIPAAGR